MQGSSQTNQLLKEASLFLHDAWGETVPDTCMICGSGWGPLAEDLPGARSLPYEEIPGMSATTIDGHNGQLHLCKIGDRHTLIFQGRRHFYEGDGWGPVRFPILLAHRLGVRNLLLTNAAGGIRSSFEVGDMINRLSIHLECGSGLQFMLMYSVLGTLIMRPRLSAAADVFSQLCLCPLNRIFKQGNVVSKIQIIRTLAGCCPDWRGRVTTPVSAPRLLSSSGSR